MKGYQYGYNIKEIGKNVYRPELKKEKWGYFGALANNENYILEQIFIKKGGNFEMKGMESDGKEKTIYLESGSATVDSKDLKPRQILLFPADFKNSINIVGKEDSFIYIFSGASSAVEAEKNMQVSETFDRRKKDWAESLIETIANRKYTGKRIFFKKGNKSSLHFHCEKSETYFIHSGKLLLRFRAGQGEDKYFVVAPGQAVSIPRGLMHQTGALEDLTIIEISTPDKDADSFIVESEFAEMPELKNKLKTK